MKEELLKKQEELCVELESMGKRIGEFSGKFYADPLLKIPVIIYMKKYFLELLSRAKVMYKGVERIHTELEKLGEVDKLETQIENIFTNAFLYDFWDSQINIITEELKSVDFNKDEFTDYIVKQIKLSNDSELIRYIALDYFGNDINKLVVKKLTEGV